MTTIWTTSDTHFGHKNIISHADRPFDSVEEMDEALIDHWNATVSRDDEVWFLGDFSFSKFARTVEIFERLKGQIHLVRGNHDDKKVRGLPWASVTDLTELRFGGHKFVLCHYPLEVWNNAHHGAIHLHGHSHGTGRIAPRRMDVGVDCVDGYRPIALETIIAEMADDAFIAADHHGAE